MNCEQYERLLLKYESGEASEEELRQMAEHEKTCTSCAAQRSASDAVIPELQNLRDDIAEMPLDFHDKWTSAIRKEQKQAKKPRIRILGIAAACLVLFVSIGSVATRSLMEQKRISTKSSRYSYEPEAVYEGSMAYYAEEASAADYEDYYPPQNDGLFMSSKSTASGTNDDGSSVTAVEDTRKIIRTASLDITTTTFDESLEKLQALCLQHKGWTSQSSVSTGNNGLKRANITMRIPSENLDAFLNGTADVGRITSRNESAEDVTESYADTKSRLKTQQLLLDRLQALVGKTAKLEDLLKLEDQIADTQYRIDSLTSSLIHTDRQVSDSTVSITLREEKKEEIIETKNISFGERIAAAFSLGIKSFVEWVQDLLLAIMAILPFILLLTVIGLIVWRIIRHMRHRK